MCCSVHLPDLLPSINPNSGVISAGNSLSFFFFFSGVVGKGGLGPRSRDPICFKRITAGTQIMEEFKLKCGSSCCDGRPRFHRSRPQLLGSVMFFHKMKTIFFRNLQFAGFYIKKCGTLVKIITDGSGYYSFVFNYFSKINLNLNVGGAILTESIKFSNNASEKPPH